MRNKGKCIAGIPAFAMALMLAGSICAGAADLRLVEAVQKQDQKLVSTLLIQKCNVNTRSDDGSTALLWAAHWNDLEIGRLLIRSGADPNAANSFSMTPLSEACTNGSAGFVDLLLKSGANPNISAATGV